MRQVGTPGSTDEPLVQTLLKQIFTLTAQTSVSTADLLKELELTEPLVTALWRLDPEAAPPSMRALAATMNCDPSTVSFIIDRLERRGLIHRQTDPADRRVKVIMLTRQGVATRARFVEAVTAGSPLGRLAGEEQQQLRILLAKAGLDPADFTCPAALPAD
ncbi:MarR family winged helix-turn-helix transcriptional regulator [Actinomadura alba]